MLYIIVNFTTQCGENRHTDIANFATLIHTQKINTLCGDFYHTVWQLGETGASWAIRGKVGPLENYVKNISKISKQ